MGVGNRGKARKVGRKTEAEREGQDEGRWFKGLGNPVLPKVRESKVREGHKENPKKGTHDGDCDCSDPRHKKNDVPRPSDRTERGTKAGQLQAKQPAVDSRWTAQPGQGALSMG